MTISLDKRATAFAQFVDKWGARLAVAMGMTIETLDIQETDIVLAVPFDKGKNSYNIVLMGDAKHAFEERMSDKDVFLFSELNAYLVKISAAGDYAKTWFSYTDKTEFNGAKDGRTEAAALESFWHGKLKISRGGKLIYEQRLQNLLQIPDRQLSDGVQPTMKNEPVALVRKPVFGGKDKIDIVLDLGELSNEARELITGKIGPDGSEKTDTQNYAIFILRGLKVTEAAEKYAQLK